MVCAVEKTRNQQKKGAGGEELRKKKTDSTGRPRESSCKAPWEGRNALWLAPNQRKRKPENNTGRRGVLYIVQRRRRREGSMTAPRKGTWFRNAC